MAPTRELALQIFSVLQNLAKFMTVSMHCCVGGTAVQEDNEKLKNGVQVVVGTPGRVNDLVQRGYLDARIRFPSKASEGVSQTFFLPL